VTLTIRVAQHETPEAVTQVLEKTPEWVSVGAREVKGFGGKAFLSRSGMLAATLYLGRGTILATVSGQDAEFVLRVGKVVAQELEHA
jgi:hypothetical protein